MVINFRGPWMIISDQALLEGYYWAAEIEDYNSEKFHLSSSVKLGGVYWLNRKVRSTLLSLSALA